MSIKKKPNRSRLFPCGQTRREFVWEMGAGFSGLALTSLLGADSFFAKHAHALGQAATTPLAPRRSSYFGKAKSCIFLMMNGGPSQVDTFDYKPELQKYAGKSLPKDKKYINSGGRRVGYLTPNWRPFRPGGQSGLLVSDYFPNVRRHADKLAVVKSCQADSHAHGSALVAMNTGSTFIGRPSLGSWCVYGLGTENQSLPGYVVMLDKRGGPISGQPNWSSGFMPSTFHGTLFRPSGNPILDLQGPSHLDAVAQRRQLDLLAQLNQKHLDERPGGRELAARIEMYELAYRMQSETPEAVDLSKETQATRNQYGIGMQPTDEYGRNCLIARRLVERGVRFVQLFHGALVNQNVDTWDAHFNLIENHTMHAQEVDKPIAGLIQDLKQRGMLEDTLIIWHSEFGRMPISQRGIGRDHNPGAMTVWMAGAGIQGGQIIGSTDEFGYRAEEQVVTYHDIHASMLHLMGLDHKRLTYSFNGRHMRLTDVHGELIPQIVA